MKNPLNTVKKWFILSFLVLALPGITLLGQEEEEEGGDDGGGDGGSAAEAAVTTGGTSQPASAVSGAIESNPIAALVRSGVSLSDAIKFTPNQVTTLTRAGIKPEDIANIDPDTVGSTTNKDLLIAIAQVTSEANYSPGFQTALAEAVKIASAILTDKTITTASDLPTAITSDSLSSSYNTELIRILAKYGAIGSNGDNVANAVLGTDYAAFTSSQSLSSLLQSSTASYLGNLSDLGARTFSTEDAGHSVLNLSMSNVTLAPAANITVSSDASIDVDNYLGAAATSSDSKVFVIGAAKDLTIAGDVTFTNTNTAENHALVIGAADDLYFRSEYSTATSADYAAPNPITVKYEGSNLGIGSYDSMRLVNVNMETGGNLALGTLKELHIGLSDGHSSTFTVGNGGNSPDNVYLYANELISINGLQFSGKVDDIYMESITINLSNVEFPQNSDVMLRSRDGTMNFGRSQPGSVNFIKNVKYGDTPILSESQFNGTAGHWDSTDLTLPNGKAAIKVRGF
jgi:hypothetical protein